MYFIRVEAQQEGFIPFSREGEMPYTETWWGTILTKGVNAYFSVKIDIYP